MATDFGTINKFFRGDTIPFTFQVTDNAGAPLNVTGSKFYFTGKRDLKDIDARAIFKLTTDAGGGLTITSATTGEVSGEVPAEKTRDLEPDGNSNTITITCDAQEKDANNKIHTIAFGKIVLPLDVTRET